MQKKESDTKKAGHEEKIKGDEAAHSWDANKFANAIKESEAKYADKSWEADIDSKNAGAYAHRNTDFMKEAEALYGRGSDEFAKYVEDARRGKAKGADKELKIETIDRKIAEKIAEGKGDSQEVKDLIAVRDKETGNAPTTSVKTANQNARIANKLRQHTRAVEMPKEYLGKGGNQALYKDMEKYEKTKDPKEKQIFFERLRQAYLADKIMPEYAGYQLISFGTKDVQGAREAQERILTKGWPETIRFQTNRLPKEIIDSGNEEHDRVINDIVEERERLTDPKYKPKEQQQSGADVFSEAVKTPTQETVIIITPQGELVEIPAEFEEKAMAAGGKRYE